MAALATFAEHHLYQTHLFGQNLLLKSHPAHEDAMGESALFTSPHREYPSISDAITWIII